MSYRFSEDAIADLEEIFEYLENYSVEAAAKLFDRIRQRAKLTVILSQYLNQISAIIGVAR